MQSDNRRIFRVDKATVIIFSVLLSPLLFLGLAALFSQNWHNSFLCLIYLGFLYWICSPTIELLPDKLVYRWLFIRREADLTRVQAVRVTNRRPRFASGSHIRFYPPRLELYAEHNHQPFFNFIIKPFSKAGVVAVMQHVRACAPQAHFDHISTSLLDGDFRPVTAQTINQDR